MATYHFSVKSKNKGYATQHYLYIARLMQYEDIRKKSEEVLEHVEPGRCMPSWVKDPIEFWSAADAHERANAKVYIEYEIALPCEFTAEQRKTLVETFLDQHMVKHQLPHSYAIHNVKSRISKQEQPHCHLMFSLKVDDGLERTAEQYFKRYNPKDPSKGGVKKVQLQDGHQNYSEFLLFIRKAWENHLNDALAQHCPTVTYHIDGQDIQIKNRVSADNYENYNQAHGTLYLPEPKLGTGKQNETLEYLQRIQHVREHNDRERKLEYKQKQLDQSQDPFHSMLNDPYSSLEVMHYLNFMARKAKNQVKIKPDIQQIAEYQKPILAAEKWNMHRMDYELLVSFEQKTPQIDFQIPATVPLEKYLAQRQPAEAMQNRTVAPGERNRHRDDYDFGGP